MVKYGSNLCEIKKVEFRSIWDLNISLVAPGIMTLWTFSSITCAIVQQRRHSEAVVVRRRTHFPKSYRVYRFWYTSPILQCNMDVNLKQHKSQYLTCLRRRRYNCVYVRSCYFENINVTLSCYFVVRIQTWELENNGSRNNYILAGDVKLQSLLDCDF